MYSLTLVPSWCRMSIRDHQDGLGGCWGISNGFVAALGFRHCQHCSFASIPLGGWLRQYMEVPR